MGRCAARWQWCRRRRYAGEQFLQQGAAQAWSTGEGAAAHQPEGFIEGGDAFDGAEGEPPFGELLEADRVAADGGGEAVAGGVRRRRSGQPRPRRRPGRAHRRGWTPGAHPQGLRPGLDELEQGLRRAGVPVLSLTPGTLVMYGSRKCGANGPSGERTRGAAERRLLARLRRGMMPRSTSDVSRRMRSSRPVVTNEQSVAQPEVADWPSASAGPTPPVPMDPPRRGRRCLPLRSARVGSNCCSRLEARPSAAGLARFG